MSYAKKLYSKYESETSNTLNELLSTKSGLVQLGSDSNPLFYQEYDESTGKYSLWVNDVDQNSNATDPDYSDLNFSQVVELLTSGLKALNPDEISGEVGEKLSAQEFPDVMEFINSIVIIPNKIFKGESGYPIEVDFTVGVQSSDDCNKAVDILAKSFNILKITDKLIGVILRSTQDITNAVSLIQKLLTKNRISNPKIIQ